MIPQSFRFSPHLKHPDGDTFPGIVAPFETCAGEITGIHRTYLSVDGPGKADIQPAKAMLGPVAGSAIHLSDPGERLFLCEGIETGLALRQAAGVPVWVVGSASGFGTADVPSSVKEVIIVADNDQDGLESATKAVERLRTGSRRSALLVPERSGDDFNDVLVRDGAQAIRQAIATLDHVPAQPSDDTDKKGGNPSQATILADLAGGEEYFLSSAGLPFVTAKIKGMRQTWPLRSEPFHDYLALRFWEDQQRAPSAQAVADAKAILSGRARFEGEVHRVHFRVASHGDCMYLDLVNDRWEVIEISPDGWRVITDPPVKFRRARGMLPLPYPVPGGTVEELWRFANVTKERDRLVATVWLTQALRDARQYPIVNCRGEQDSSKTTTTQVFRGLIDPHESMVRSAPRGERDLAIAARNSWVLAFDNLSNLPEWLSNALCRIATGGGFGTRQLFADEEEVIFDERRPVIVSGIEELVNRPDLQSRVIPFDLPRLTDEQRIPDATFWAAYEEARPRLLGALLDLVAAANRILPTVHLPAVPRMADFATWGVAVEQAAGWPDGAFLAAYAGIQQEAQTAVLEGSLLAATVIAVLDERDELQGTATELLDLLEAQITDEQRKAKEWPGNARVLSGRLRSFAPALRAAGVTINFDQEPDSRSRKVIAIRKERGSCVASDAEAAPHLEDSVATTLGASQEGPTASQREVSAPDGASQESQASQDHSPFLEGGVGEEFDLPL